ncbi:MAG: DUF6516 family protein [Pseudomonadota bacterium]
MLLNLTERYRELVQSCLISEFDQAGANLRFKAKIVFVDGSVLSIRQVVFGEFMFKYAYHWQDKMGALICRWDNSPHWPGISTYPHHKHETVTNEVIVRESLGGDLEEVFEEITATIRINSCRP